MQLCEYQSMHILVSLVCKVSQLRFQSLAILKFLTPLLKYLVLKLYRLVLDIFSKRFLNSDYSFEPFENLFESYLCKNVKVDSHVSFISCILLECSEVFLEQVLEEYKCSNLVEMCLHLLLVRV